MSFTNAVAWIAALSAALLTSTANAQDDCRGWQEWRAFTEAHVSPDGRVVDHSTPQQHTVSEGQAYALFFALVAGDKDRFQTILTWTQNNLAGGDLSARLPGWQWGKTTKGKWQLLDANSASDADLWMAYALLEAGRLWKHVPYTELGQSLAQRLLTSTTEVLPGLGRTLLPAPMGFQIGRQRWRLNPSYLPMPVLRRMVTLFPTAGWHDMVEPTVRLLVESAPLGFSPEWIVWDSEAGWEPDAATARESSYNAIRTYLWTGMSQRDPSFERLKEAFVPWMHWVTNNRMTPERIDAFAPYTPAKINAGPVGFDAAALPLADVWGLTPLRDELLARIHASLQKSAPPYYSHALVLFGMGWMQGRYRFAPDGALLLPLEGTCLP